jgi:hypothetical protein
LREAAGKYTEQALRTLVSIMDDPGQPGASRAAAATALLDRGHGRPYMTQDLTVNENRSFVVAPKTATREEWEAICAKMRATPRDQQSVTLAALQQKPLLPKIAGKKLPAVN